MIRHDTFVFTSKPKALARPKYREPEPQQEENAQTSTCLTYDPRVRRGITIGKPMKISTTEPANEGGKPSVTEIKRAAERARKQREDAGLIRPTFPSVRILHDTIKVPKIREEVPLHLFLEEQVETKATVHIDSQTDVFLEEDPEPGYLPRKTGVDVGSQVDTAQVFVFDRDVEPVLEVVASKTLEQSLMEVREEEELAAMGRRKFELERKFEIEAQQAAALLETEKDRFARKKFQLEAARLRMAREQQANQKMASAFFARRFLSKLPDSVFTHLARAGFIVDPVRQAVEDFLPEVYRKADDKLRERMGSEQLLDDMLSSLLQEQQAERDLREQQRHEAAEKARAEAERARQAKRRMVLQLFIHSDLSPTPVGPIQLTGQSTVRDVQEKVKEWMQANMQEPPDVSKISFLWGGQKLDPESVLHEVGVETMATISMALEP